jgi:branched-chain amino acid transport system ATP-binding protein
MGRVRPLGADRVTKSSASGRGVSVCDYSHRRNEGSQGVSRPGPGGNELMTESTDAGGAPETILAVNNLEVVYNDVVLAVRGISLQVPRGSIVAVLGANGAGKTTVLRAVTGLLDVHRARITKGDVELEGRRIDRDDPAAIVRAGVAQVMEGRRVFSALSVDENLRAGAYTRRSKSEVAQSYERVMDLFPVLGERRRSIAGYLSGGEQQMVAMGRALMASPKVLLLDEPSLGLAPLIVEQIGQIIAEVNRQGTRVLLVEQNAARALGVAHHGYVVENGRVVKDGPAAELREDKDIQEFYLGVGEAGRKSFRDVKTYRRRKRWSA